MIGEILITLFSVLFPFDNRTRRLSYHAVRQIVHSEVKVKATPFSLTPKC